MASTNKERINWIDTTKGFGIIMVVYAHNFPYLESYIYTFHMPLFFFIAGLFHPNQINLEKVKKRTQQILIPYFLWSILLFVFWFFIGRKYGDSSIMDLSVFKNLIGIFLAQGDHDYMNWGIPMWFLPAIFLSFLIFGLVRKLKNNFYQLVIVLLLIGLGFVIPKYSNLNFIWSLDVAMVSLSFYASAFYLKDFLKRKKNYQILLLSVFLILHLCLSVLISNEVDMYRSIYGNNFLFLLSAFAAIGFWMFLFKTIKKIGILSFFGRNTIPVLALQIRTVSVIKLLLIIFLGFKTFDFNEIEIIMLTLAQLTLLYPLLLLIDKKLPILNGKRKNLEKGS